MEDAPVSRGTSCAGFTLRELLVVVGVLGVLACLLVSATAAGGSRSRVVQCSDNLKQYGLALQIYGGENQGNLPRQGFGYWPWNLVWSTGTTITQWISFRQLYCPGTSVRFTDQDNLTLWNYASGLFHVSGYATTFAGGGNLVATNENSTLTPRRIPFGNSYLPAPVPAQRPLLADATMSQYLQYRSSARYTYNYTDIRGAIVVPPHLTAHLNGVFPAGGNVAMLDGHVEWRKFDSMLCRSKAPNQSALPGFWW